MIGKIDLKSAIKFYYQKREEDSDNIMVKIFADSGMGSSHRVKESNLFMLLDKESKIHYYDYFNLNEPTFQWEKTSRMNLKSVDKLKIECNLLDTDISICSQDILQHFSSEESGDITSEIEFLRN